MAGGLLLGLAGVWVVCQVLGGNALGRLGISGDPDGGGLVSIGQKMSATKDTHPGTPFTSDKWS